MYRYSVRIEYYSFSELPSCMRSVIMYVTALEVYGLASCCYVHWILLRPSVCRLLRSRGVHPPKTRTQTPPPPVWSNVYRTHTRSCTFWLSLIDYSYSVPAQTIWPLFLPFYWYFHCIFSTTYCSDLCNIRLVLLLLFADASCLLQRRIRKIIFGGAMVH